MGKINLDTGAAVNIFPVNWVPTEQETEDSTKLPVVSAFLTVELGSFKATTKMAEVDL